MIRAFVTGWPISHSISPILHNYWLKLYNIDGSYEALAINVDDFAVFLKNLEQSGFAGGNITIPHKIRAFEICNQLDEAAAQIGAVNTVWHENGQLSGSNTDSYGFSASLDAAAPGWQKSHKALVLGAGGAARAIIHALITHGIDEVIIANRTIEKAVRLQESFGDRIKCATWDERSQLAAQCGLIVNTTALGMRGQPSLEIDLSRVSAGGIVVDIVYNPLSTPLLEQARHYGLTAVDGLGMLMHQAIPGFEKWFGQKPEVTTQLRKRLLDNMLSEKSDK
jgi:shikimate dehydrogenase